jgi:hypothetical protein
MEYSLENLDISEYERAIACKLVAASQSKNYNEAKREWVYKGEVVEHDQLHPKNCDLCNHGIKYGFILHNTVNGRALEVGSECVGNYATTAINYSKVKSDKKYRQEKNFRANKKEIDAAVVYPILKAIRIDLESRISHNDEYRILTAKYNDLKNMQYWRKTQKFTPSMISLMLEINEIYKAVNHDVLTKYGVTLTDKVLKHREWQKMAEEIEKEEAEKNKNNFRVKASA